HAPYEPPQSARRDRVAAPPPGVDEAAATAKLMDSNRWDEVSSDEVTYLASLYRAEVAALDASLANLFQQLRSRGILDHAIVVITADHGEEFRDHGWLAHGSSLFEEVVRIPLIVAGPGLPSHRVITEPVSLVDIAPTVLDLVGLPPEPRFEGRSLREALAGDDPPDIFLELLPTSTTGDLRRHEAGLVHGGLKLLEPPYPDQADRRAKAYDLREDPHETHPDPAAVEKEAAALEARLVQRRDELATRAGAVTQPAPLDDAARARMRALGYAQRRSGPADEPRRIIVRGRKHDDHGSDARPARSRGGLARVELVERAAHEHGRPDAGDHGPSGLEVDEKGIVGLHRE